MRENATHKIMVAGLIPVIKDVALLKQNVSPFAGCYCPHLGSILTGVCKKGLWTVANLQLVH
jgi:hypothetical protein